MYFVFAGTLLSKCIIKEQKVEMYVSNTLFKTETRLQHTFASIKLLFSYPLQVI